MISLKPIDNFRNINLPENKSVISILGTTNNHKTTFALNLAKKYMDAGYEIVIFHDYGDSNYLHTLISKMTMLTNNIRGCRVLDIDDLLLAVKAFDNNPQRKYVFMIDTCSTTRDDRDARLDNLLNMVNIEHDNVITVMTHQLRRNINGVEFLPQHYRPNMASAVVFNVKKGENGIIDLSVPKNRCSHDSDLQKGIKVMYNHQDNSFYLYKENTFSKTINYIKRLFKDLTTWLKKLK